jgi:2-polyprenyl-6-methoxyphenol hydroxylase-like FAD-dependent oxidoreductase
MVSTHCHVIVVGAGIGGLTAALSLQRHGFKVSVYEQASELREFGAGLMVTPNAMHALKFLGVAEVIAATSNVSNEHARSTGQCNTACSLSAGVWKPKVFRGR